MALDAYNAQYPLAYYEVGTAYSFYQHKQTPSNVTSATVEQVSKFKSALADAKRKNVFIPENGEWQAFKRCIGVVVNKYKHEKGLSNNSQPIGVLEVMFEDNGEYTIRKYGIEMPSVFFDDKEVVPVHERKTKTTGPATESVTGPTTEGNNVTGPTVSAVTGPTVE